MAKGANEPTGGREAAIEAFRSYMGSDAPVTNRESIASLQRRADRRFVERKYQRSKIANLAAHGSDFVGRNPNYDPGPEPKPPPKLADVAKRGRAGDGSGTRKGRDAILPGSMPTSPRAGADRALSDGKEHAAPKPPSEKRLAAIKAYADAHGGREPPKSMSIKRMVAKTAGMSRGFAGTLGKGLAGNSDVDTGFGRARNNAVPMGRAKTANGGLLSPPPASLATPSPAARAPIPPGWRDMRGQASPITPNAPQASMMQRVGGAYNTFNKVGGVVATGVAAAQQFNAAKQRGETTMQAAGEAAVAAAPGAIMLAAQPVGGALSRFGSSALSIAGDILASPSATDFLLGWPVAKAGVVTGLVGGAAKIAGEGLKIAGKAAAPLMAAYGAYKGAQGDANKIRGAARGALGALDPTGIVTNLGAATGLMSDHRSLGERAFDAAFGKADATNSSQQALVGFEKANASFERGRAEATASAGGESQGAPRGWANPANQFAAQAARGVVNYSQWAESGKK
jgi:hypothetical protein